jgi:hypothetical protein
MTNHTEEEISISVHHWKSREVAKGLMKAKDAFL